MAESTPMTGTLDDSIDLDDLDATIADLRSEPYGEAAWQRACLCSAHERIMYVAERIIDELELPHRRDRLARRLCLWAMRRMYGWSMR